MSRCLLTAVLACGLLPAGARAEEPSPGAATPQEIAAWVAELDDNLFDTREKAQARLEGAGLPALDAVSQVATAGSLESSTRALNVLLAWSECDDNALRIAALERIVKLPQRPTEAQLATEILADAREEAALAKIVELGGAHSPDPQYVGGAIVLNPGGRPVGPVQVIIGSHWKGGAEGLEHLKDVRRATTISLHSPPLGDDVIPQLLELRQTKRIELYGTKFTPEGIAKLREKLTPEVALAVRSGAQLGIQGSQLSALAQVERVVEGSAAERAGLQQGDVITQLDGQEIKDFTSLTDKIATYEPGDSVTLKVTRPSPAGDGGRQLDIKVTFDRWGENKNAPSFVQPAGQQFHGQIVPPATIRIERR